MCFGLIILVDAASNGGTSTSGDTVGGDVARRAYDADTAGGDSHSGASSDVNGGSVVNKANDDGQITNDASSEFSLLEVRAID